MKLTTALILASCAALVVSCSPKLEGVWYITATCPAESEYGQRVIRAKANASEISPNEFVGEITNDLGQTGQFRSVLENNRLVSETTWAGLLPTTSRLTLDRRSGSFIGIDSIGCALVVIRP